MRTVLFVETFMLRSPYSGAVDWASRVETFFVSS
jgi:hypothetical protein